MACTVAILIGWRVFGRNPDWLRLVGSFLVSRVGHISNYDHEKNKSTGELKPFSLVQLSADGTVRRTDLKSNHEWIHFVSPSFLPGRWGLSGVWEEEILAHLPDSRLIHWTILIRIQTSYEILLKVKFVGKSQLGLISARVFPCRWSSFSFLREKGQNGRTIVTTATLVEEVCFSKRTVRRSSFRKNRLVLHTSAPMNRRQFW